jgi:hypothetical protein
VTHSPSTLTHRDPESSGVLPEILMRPTHEILIRNGQDRGILTHRDIDNLRSFLRFSYAEYRDLGYIRVLLGLVMHLSQGPSRNRHAPFARQCIPDSRRP